MSTPAPPVGADFYSPLLLRVAPDGTVTADFEGHLSADGLDLTAGDSSTPPDDHKIRWLREDDGTVVAAVWGYYDDTAPVGQRNRLFLSAESIELVRVTASDEVAGRIAAEGVDLPAHEDTTAPEPHSLIRWLRESDGTQVAQLGGLHDDAIGERLASLGAGTGFDDDTYGRIVARDGVGGTAPNERARVEAEARRAAPSTVWRRTLLDSVGRSGWLMVDPLPDVDRAANDAYVSWSLVLAQCTFDAPSLAANTGTTWTLNGWVDIYTGASFGSAPNIGDIVLMVEVTTHNAGLVKASHRPDVTVAGDILYRVRNVTGAAIDEPTRTFVAAWLGNVGF